MRQNYAIVCDCDCECQCAPRAITSDFFLLIRSIDRLRFPVAIAKSSGKFLADWIPHGDLTVKKYLKYGVTREKRITERNMQRKTCFSANLFSAQIFSEVSAHVFPQ